MPLPYRVKSKEEVPENFAALYVERDGAWWLDVDGAVDRTRLDEFRSNNVSLKRQLDELAGKFQGIDQDVARELLRKQQDLEDEKLVKAGDVEQLVASRTKQIKAQLETQLQAMTVERDKLQSRLSEIEINQRAIETATKRGLKPTAIPDLVGRARSNFRLIEGKPVAYEPDGKTVRIGKDGNPLTLDEWCELLVARRGRTRLSKYSFLFIL